MKPLLLSELGIIGIHMLSMLDLKTIKFMLEVFLSKVEKFNLHLIMIGVVARKPFKFAFCGRKSRVIWIFRYMNPPSQEF